MGDTTTVKETRTGRVGSIYRGMARVRRACLNCHQRKTKCPGEKPHCSNCRRLNKNCCYLSAFDASTNIDIHTRVRNLESKLEFIANSITSSSIAYDIPAVDDSPFNAETASAKSHGVETTGIALHSRGGDGEAQFSPSTSSSPSSQPNRKLVEIPSIAVQKDAMDTYHTHCHRQPLTLLGNSFFTSQPGEQPSLLIWSVIALSLRFSNHPYFALRKAAAVEYYAALANGELFRRLQGTADVGITTLQSICLLVLVDFAAGKTREAWIKLGLGIRLVQCAGITTELPSRMSLEELEERNRLLWSYFTLDQIYGNGVAINPLLRERDCCFNNPGSGEGLALDVLRLSASIKPSEGSVLTDGSLETSDVEYEGHMEKMIDLEIAAYALEAVSIWGKIVHYTVNPTRHTETPPWSTTSQYSSIKSSLLQYEATFSLSSHSFCNRNFSDWSLTELENNRSYWCPWYFIQFTYHAGWSLLDHPYISSKRSKQFAGKIPFTFVCQSSEAALVHSNWIAQFISMVKGARFTINDPFIGYCSAIAATVHLYFYHVDDCEVADSASKNFDSAMEFLNYLGNYWPHLRVIRQKLTLLSQNAASWPTISQALLFTLEIGQVSETILLELLDYSATWTGTGSSSPREDFGPGTHYIRDHGDSNFYSSQANTSPSHAIQAQTWGSPEGEQGASREDSFSQVTLGNVAAWIPNTLDYTISNQSWSDFGRL